MDDSRLEPRLEKLRTQRTVLERRKRIRDDQDEDRQTVLAALSEYSDDEIAEPEDAGEDVLHVDHPELAPSLTDEGSDLLEEEIEELESFIQEVKQVDDDPKMDRLCKDLTHPPATTVWGKIVVFRMIDVDLGGFRASLENRAGTVRRDRWIAHLR